MPSHTARLLVFPFYAAVLSAAALNWQTDPISVAPPVSARSDLVQQARPEGNRLPQLIAVNRRIAKRVNALRPGVKQRLLHALNRLPARVTLLVTSARRTRSEQAALRSSYGVKARPGYSTHEDGRAIDVNVLVDGERISPRENHRVIGVAMAQAGFKALGPADPVHYSVPKEDLDLNVVHGPKMEVMTWAEMRDLQASIKEPPAEFGLRTASAR